MELSDDLCKQAWQLAKREPKRPRQVSLRRAISAAYYSLFHLLIEAATRQFAGGRDLAGVRHVLSRGFDHGQMNAASVSFAGGTLPAQIRAVMPLGTVPADVRFVARTFVRLQQTRHEADYNPAARFFRPDVLAQLQDLDEAFAAWRRVRKDPMAILYLGLLGSFESVRRR